MAIRNVVKEGDPILRKKCREITEVNDHIRMTMEDMLETMRAEMGVGIAGPQVGVMRRMFVAEPEPDRVYFMINPEITEKEDIEFAVNLTHFLNYSIFQKAGQEEQPLITITYHLTDGNAVSVSANREMVWWKGKVHVLRKEDLFVNLTENIFFSDE